MFRLLTWMGIMLKIAAGACNSLVSRSIRIAKPKACEDLALAILHRLRLLLGLVIETEQGQYPVHHDVRPVGVEGLALLARLARGDRRARHAGGTQQSVRARRPLCHRSRAV